jgi:undecaprenyl-diphosphatase
MLAAVIWGLIQGFTEFLPVSSSGHLVIIPAFLEKWGVDVSPPSLAVSAVLHLGTLVAVLVYYRSDVAKVLRFWRDAEGRRIGLLVLIGSIPAVIGLPLADTLNEFQQDVANVGWALMFTGVVLVVGQRLATGARSLIDGRIPDAIVVGAAQAIALIPGVSRSGMTISAANGRKFEPTQAARFSFLLGIPAIAGGGLIELLDLQGSEELGPELFVGMAVAAVSGYAAISLLLAALKKVGLYPFAIYCLVVGALTVAAF